MAASKAATEKDVKNTQAWAEVVDGIMVMVPAEIRADVLRAVCEKDRERRKDKRPRILSYDEFSRCDSPYERNRNAIMRINALVVQILVRTITSCHSQQDAAAILFAPQRFGHGSGALLDYIGDLPRPTVSRSR